MPSRYRKMSVPTRSDMKAGPLQSIVSLSKTLESTTANYTQGLMDILVSILSFGFLHTKTNLPRDHTPRNQDRLCGK